MADILWTRVVLAGFASEAGVVATLFLAIAIYRRFNSSPDLSTHTLGERMGYYVAPPAGVVTTFLAALWVTRAASGQFLTNGFLVAVVSVILTLGFALQAKPEHRLMYGIAFALRLVAGGAAGVVGRMLH